MSVPPKIQQGASQDANTDLVQDTKPSFADTLVAEDEAQLQKTRDSARNTLHQDVTKPEPKESHYQAQDTKSKNPETNQAFGRKINVNPEVARQSEGLESAQNSYQSAFAQKALPATIPQNKSLPPPPEGSDLRQVLQNRAFQGPLKDGTLYQKIEQRAMSQMPSGLAQQMRNQGEPLTRSEVAQLFSMRSRADLNKEERDALRRLIHYEVALLNRSREKVASIRYQTESHDHTENPEALIRSERTHTRDATHKDWLDRLARSAESFFEKVLQKVLGTGQSSVNDLPDGGAPQWPGKNSAEWEAFFQRLSGLQSQVVADSVTQDELAKILFRGLFLSDGQMRMVSDVSLNQNGEINEHKFAQILLSDPKIAALLSSLKPGQTLPADILQALGDQMILLKLVHLLPENRIMTDAEKQALLKQFRREVSGGYQKSLEDELYKSRRNKKPNEPFTWAGDQFDKKEERRGLRTILTYLSYFIFASGVAMGVYFLVQTFF